MIRLILVFMISVPSFAGHVAIEQNLTYYCMEKRKHPKFQKTSCKSYAYKTLYRCQREKKRSTNAILKCLKRSLKI